MNLLIPMAGAGSRFKQAGYRLPKPLIDVNGKTMIRRVVENLKFFPFSPRHIFIINKEHVEYGLRDELLDIDSKATIIETDGLTEGAACTCLLARKMIDSPWEGLIIANCDQIMDWDLEQFKLHYNWGTYGVIFTFQSTSPKNSYVAFTRRGEFITCREKDVISDVATTGVYYFRHGHDFVSSADRMIEANYRVNNEFYVAPVYNFMKNKNIASLDVRRHWPIGTPEDLEKYIEYLQTK